MAIMRLNSGAPGTPGIGSNATTTGITEPTSASAERSYGTIVRAKDKDGDVVAALVGKESYSLSISGYSSSSGGPGLGDAIEVAGLEGKVTGVNIEKSVEDFSRFTAEGRGIPAAS